MITDRAGALSGGDNERIQAAFDRLTEDTGLQLFVVYVDSFDGADGQDWANETADMSGLGTDDILLAVATGDRSFGISVSDQVELSDAELDDVRRNDIRPALSDEDWAGAAIAGADGYREAAQSSGSSFGALAAGGVVVVGAGAAGWWYLRRRNRGKGQSAADGTPADELAGLSTDELDKRASAALVEIDDALKTSEQELGFAEAQFGTEATSDFNELLTKAKADVTQAFTLRQRLDDSEPETEPQARSMTAQIIMICRDVSESLDAQAEAFDQLRDLHARAPEVLEQTMRQAAEVEQRIATAHAQLDQLALTYPPAALASVSGNPEQASRLIGSAREAVAKGQAALQGDDRATAVAQARAAEDAVAQAAKLLEMVANAESELSTAAQRIGKAVESVSLDIADAARLAPGDPAVTAASAAAQQAVAAGQASVQGGDPLAALNQLADAETKLDDLLAPVRTAAAEAEKARTALNETLGRVLSQVKAVNDFIETRRGAVGPEARTRLSEAARHLGQGQSLAASDPAAALEAAMRADQMSRQAQQLAEQDVQAWERQQNAGQSSGGGGGLNSMILGGILINSMRGGGGLFGGGSGGGGGFGGSTGRRSSGSARRPGSFGGGGTRGRRGGGGRF